MHGTKVFSLVKCQHYFPRNTILRYTACSSLATEQKIQDAYPRLFALLHIHEMILFLYLLVCGEKLK